MMAKMGVNTMREQRAAQAAEQANAASEAGRVLQAQRQQIAPDTSVEPAGEDTPVDVTPRNPVRDAGMAMIEARMKRNGDPGAEPDPEPAETHIHPAVKAAETPQPVAEVAPIVEAAPAVETVRVKVDGEEFDVPKDEVDEAGGVQAYRILKAQENRLKKTSDNAAEVRKMRDEFASLIQQITQQRPPQKSQQEVLAAAMQKIRFGSDEDAVQAMAELQSHNRVDQNAITQRAIAQVELNSAAARFKGKNQDILAIPMLARMAAIRENELLQQGIPADFDKFYGQIEAELRSVTGRPSQATTTPPATDHPSQATADREARKASIVNLPTAGQRASLPTEETVLTPEQERKSALADMNKARGKAY